MKKLAAPAAVLAVALTLVVAPAAPASDPTAGADRLILDLTGHEDRTVPVAPAEFTGPTQATGIGPGSHLLIEGIEGDEDSTFACTANFVWESGGRQYLGAAGHCFLPLDKDTSHGTGDQASVSGVRVRVCVADCSFGGQLGFVIEGQTVDLGGVAYARQSLGDEDVGNDFGLVEIPASAEHLIRPWMPVFGGPTTSGALDAGDLVCHYGNGVVVGETWPTMGRVGAGVASFEDEGWWWAELAITFGDSGSAVQVCEPGPSGPEGVTAAGILTHLGAGAFGTTMNRAVEMAREAGLSISLVPEGGDGGEPAPDPEPVSVASVSPSQVPAGATTRVTISGNGFASGAEVVLAGGKGGTPTVAVVSVSADGSSLTADVTPPAKGPKGSSAWDVTVTNADGGSGFLADGLTVRR
jgi:hypothetical protein